MGYITYFDLLGTKGFKDGEYEYEDNINTFYSEIRKGAVFLKGIGEIGLFSDSVYVFSRDLERLLNFLVYLRGSLCSKGLFFNAVVSTGNLSAINPKELNIDVPLYGVGFTDKSIIDLYLEQSKFKGIGIKINSLLLKEMDKIKDIKYTNSFYYSASHELVKYYDIAYNIETVPYKYKMKNILNSVIKSALKAYSINISHGKYYTSLFSTLLDSYNPSSLEWTWDNEKKIFTKLPEIFNIIINIAAKNYDECKNWIGIDALCLKILDMAIASNKINVIMLSDIISVFINYPCLSPYINSLDDMPDVFSCVNNKKKFIDFVQDYFAYDFVQKLINT